MRLRDQLDYNETILWESGKSKKVTFLESIFNPFMVFALLWGAFDFGIMKFAFIADESLDGAETIPMLAFFALHMMPVWIYLLGIITSVFSAKHTYYIVTDKNIYIQNGVFSVNTKVKPISDISHLTVHQGLIDKIFGTGDVIAQCNHMSYSGHHNDETTRIENVDNYTELFQLLKQVQNKINQNVQYNPNAQYNANVQYNPNAQYNPNTQYNQYNKSNFM